MLFVNEIYPAICGESRFSGEPCALVRLTGCHLRCSWCDSAHSFSGGESLPLAQIMERVQKIGFPTVLVTGGEPLLQPEVVPLLAALVADGHQVLLETSGTTGHDNLVPLGEVPAGVRRIVDIKAPGSGVDPKLIDWAGIAELGPLDEMKIIIAGRDDFNWARELVLSGQRIPADVRISFSAAAGLVAPAQVATWILEAGLAVTFQIQLHKALWPEKERGV